MLKTLRQSEKSSIGMADRTRSNSTAASESTSGKVTYRRTITSSPSPRTSFTIVQPLLPHATTMEAPDSSSSSRTPSGYASSCPDLMFVKTEYNAGGGFHRKLQASSSLKDNRRCPSSEGYSRHQLPHSTNHSPCQMRTTLSRKTSSVSSCRSSSEIDNLSCDEELDINKVIPEIKIDELPQSSTPFRDKNISEILSYLFVGDAEAAFREPLLCRLNIDCVVDLSNLSPEEIAKTLRLKDCPCVCPSQMKHTRNRLNLLMDDTVNEDIIHYFEEINAFIDGARKRNRKCLVYCFSGKSLSPTVVTQYLMQHNGMTLKQAFSLVKKRRPETAIPTGCRNALVRLERQLHPNTNPAIIFESEIQTEAVGHSCAQQAWT